MLKKVLVAILLTIMMLSSVTTSAYAAEKSSYGVDQSSKGYSADFNIYSSPNCTWYCWGRAYEKLGIKLPNFGDAKNWYSNAEKKGYSVGSTAMADSIVVFSDVGSATSGHGHVAYVEKVDGGKVYITEGNYEGKKYHEASFSASSGVRQSNTVYETRVVGYIYLTSTESASQSISAYWEEYSKKQSIGTTNAVLARTLRVTGASTGSISKVGIQLYDSTAKTLLAEKTEKITTSGSVVNMWYDVNGELSYKLKAGTSYQYRFSASINGAMYFSPFYSIQTAQSVSLNWAEYSKKYSVSTTNAVLSRTLSINGGSISSVKKVGIELYDSSGKTKLAQKTETPAATKTVINMWYDINGELKYSLKPKTTYKYRFVAIIGSETFYSPFYSVTTK